MFHYYKSSLLAALVVLATFGMIYLADLAGRTVLP